MMKQRARQFLHDSSGASVVEYAVLIALVSLGVFAALEAMGTSVSGFFSGTGNMMDKKAPK